MRAPRLIFALLILACGFLAGLVLSGRTRDTTTEAAAPPAQSAASRPAPVQAQLPVPQGLPDFSGVAARTVPAVANISSTQVIARQNSPLSNDPFFRYFFGDDSDLYGPQRDVERSLGSGVIVSPDGYILTNNHVVAGEQGRISLRQLPAITVSLGDKRELRAQIVGVDPTIDLALLKINATNLPTMPWGDSSQLKVAQWVLAIGNPFQLNQTVTLGIVSALGRTSLGISGYEDFIQTDAAINPGNSGGALINARGELVGINTAIFSESGGYQGIGFAIPSNLARRVVSDFLKYGEVRRGGIGYVELSPLTTQEAADLGAPNTRGVLVQRMRRDASAFEAGLRPGDIIVSFNGTAITEGGPLTRLIQDAAIGSTATMDIIREGRRVQLKIPIVRATEQ
ncbi:MAG TPA: trypsin-like peptidase domain-containing protein [Vicinamibacterales bacterium]|nr:trypsin-like peptidase domain-containing protein [Vicinamibacterales bacterium]